MAQIVSAGGVAHPYVVDVSDASAVEQFAETVRWTTEFPTSWSTTPASAWRAASWTPRRAVRSRPGRQPGRVVGCRSFSRRMVDRGTGGHIVNVASMAAYAPLQSLGAYCTSKAAVYMFSDCLRAELDSAGIGLTTICRGWSTRTSVSATPFVASGEKSTGAPKRQAQLEKMFRLRDYGRTRVAAPSLRRCARTKRSGLGA